MPDLATKFCFMPLLRFGLRTTLEAEGFETSVDDIKSFRYQNQTLVYHHGGTVPIFWTCSMARNLCCFNSLRIFCAHHIWRAAWDMVCLGFCYCRAATVNKSGVLSRRVLLSWCWFFLSLKIGMVLHWDSKCLSVNLGFSNFPSNCRL